MRTQELRPLIDVACLRRRLHIAGLLCGAGVIAASVSPVALAWGFDTAALVLFAAGAVTLLGSSLHALRSVACPVCRLPLIAYAFANVPHHSWLFWLLSAPACPRCGYSESSPGDSSAAGLTIGWSVRDL